MLSAIQANSCKPGFFKKARKKNDLKKQKNMQKKTPEKKKWLEKKTKKCDLKKQKKQ